MQTFQDQAISAEMVKLKTHRNLKFQTNNIIASYFDFLIGCLLIFFLIQFYAYRYEST